jgi:hypothetical protein
METGANTSVRPLQFTPRVGSDNENLRHSPPFGPPRRGTATAIDDPERQLFEASLAWANAHCGVKMPSPYLSYVALRRSGQALLTYDFATNDVAALVSSLAGSPGRGFRLWGSYSCEC